LFSVPANEKQSVPAAQPRVTSARAPGESPPLAPSARSKRATPSAAGRPIRRRINVQIADPLVDGSPSRQPVSARNGE
jgi:hypothetical protein